MLLQPGQNRRLSAERCPQRVLTLSSCGPYLSPHPFQGHARKDVTQSAKRASRPLRAFG